MDMSILRQIFENLQIILHIRGGDKTTSTLNVKGNMTIMHLSNQEQITNPKILVEQTERLVAEKAIHSTSQVTIALGTYLGIVFSKEKPGTRVHLDFAVLNKNETSVALEGSYVKINKGEVFFNKFYKYTDINGSRVGDFSKSFPIIINAKGADNLNVEYENIDLKLLDNGINQCEIFVLSEGNKLSSRKFKLEINNEMVQTFIANQKSADETGIPAIYPATIQA